MLLFSQKSEIRCIKTLTDRKIPETIRSTLLGKLNESHFHFPPCKAAYNRISVVARKRLELVDSDDLLEDPALEEDYRDVLRGSDIKPCGSKSGINRLLERLNEYRKIRIVYEIANTTLTKLDSDNVDTDKLLNFITEKIVSANAEITDDEKMISFGNNSNSEAIVDDVLNKPTETLLKTGFSEFDTKAGGLPEEGVCCIAPA